MFSIHIRKGYGFILPGDRKWAWYISLSCVLCLSKTWVIMNYLKIANIVHHMGLCSSNHSFTFTRSIISLVNMCIEHYLNTSMKICRSRTRHIVLSLHLFFIYNFVCIGGGSRDGCKVSKTFPSVDKKLSPFKIYFGTALLK